MNNLIHVEHVLLSLRPGGLENGVVNVVNGLDPSAFRSSICCLQHSGEFASRIHHREVTIYEMGLRSGNDIRLPFRLANHFRHTRPDIVHTRNAEAFFYGFIGAKLAGVPVIVHSEHGRTLPDKRHRMMIQRWLTNWTDAVFAVSMQLKDDLVMHLRLPSDEIEVLYNGVNLDRFASRQRAGARKMLGFNERTFLVGSVGRLVPVKNYDLLVRAVAGLREAELILIGDGPERSSLEMVARAFGVGDRIHLLGHRDDIEDLLPGLDVFVLPSFSEGMSNTLLEAMAAGVPAVASNVGGNRELIRNAIDGFLFESGDLNSLRRHLERLCNDLELRLQMGRSAAAHTRDCFSLNAMIDRYERLYARCARRCPAGEPN